MVIFTYHNKGIEKTANNELYALYSSPNTIQVINSRRMRWAGHVARMRERSGSYRVLVGKCEGRKPHGRPRRRRDDKTETDIRKVERGGGKGMGWIGLA